MSSNKKAVERRERIRSEYFAEENVWRTEAKLKGWFRAPRTLPLVLALIKEVKGLVKKNVDLTATYLELWSRHYGEGVIEMTHDREHAYAAGYQGERAIRTWRERMGVLEELNLIRSVKIGSQYKFIALINPAEFLRSLDAKGRIPNEWMIAYKAVIIDSKEPSFQASAEQQV